MKIALFRHGPTDWNADHRIQGRTDIPLSGEGLVKMRGLRAPFPAARIFSSPLLRARQSAEAMGFDRPILDDRLMEQNWGRWEGHEPSRPSAKRKGKDTPSCAPATKSNSVRPGGESTEELM